MNKRIDKSTLTSAAGFSATLNGQDVTVSNVEGDANEFTRIIITFDEQLFYNDVITVSYQSDVVHAIDETLLEDFTDLPVKNNLPLHFAIPTKIEAEAFVVNQGLQLETTSDVGGGFNVGYTTAGDYLEYRIYVAEDGDYPLESRVACYSQVGKIEFEQRTAAGEVINNVVVNVPITGGWQTWQTVTSNMTLTAGHGILRVKILQPEFNINWFRFLNAGVVSAVEENGMNTPYRIYPNPATTYITVELSEHFLAQKKLITIRSINGSLISNVHVSSKLSRINIPMDTLPSGMYIIELQSDNKIWRRKFVK